MWGPYYLAQNVGVHGNSHHAEAARFMLANAVWGEEPGRSSVGCLHALSLYTAMAGMGQHADAPGASGPRLSLARCVHDYYSV